jgi:hypothetical protein
MSEGDSHFFSPSIQGPYGTVNNKGIQYIALVRMIIIAKGQVVEFISLDPMQDLHPTVSMYFQVPKQRLYFIYICIKLINLGVSTRLKL